MSKADFNDKDHTKSNFTISGTKNTWSTLEKVECFDLAAVSITRKPRNETVKVGVLNKMLYNYRFEAVFVYLINTVRYTVLNKSHVFFFLVRFRIRVFSQLIF